MKLAAVILSAAVLAPLSAGAHVTVWPRQSDLGAREKYVIRAPNEKKVATVRIEGVFPREVQVTAFEQTPGWTLEVKHDGAGAIVGATWTGSLAPEQFAEFGVMAINPKAGTDLAWSFTQVYADGSHVEWSGPLGSKTPAPHVQLKPAEPTEAHDHH